MNLAHALARDELIRALTAYQGVATANGAGGGTTIVDSNLIGKNDFISKKAVLIMSGPAALEDRGAASFNNVTGTITLQSGFSAQITAGTSYRILNISSVEVDVADILTRIGTNTDAPGTTTLFAWLAKLFQQGGQGLVYYGVVTGVPGANQFTIPTLAGFGDTAFVGWRAFVFWDAAGGGAAPQGEQQAITVYTSATGNFTAGAFTAAVAAGDIILILHPRIAEIADLITYVDYEGATSLADKLTLVRATNLDVLGLTTYNARTVGATNVNGTTWKDLLDMSVLTQPEEIWGITLTVAGGWAGLCKYRIIRADTSAKIFPFGTECVENTDFVSGVPVNFPAPVVVPAAVGYIVQFRSTNGADGAGQTCALTELAVIQRG